MFYKSCGMLAKVSFYGNPFDSVGRPAVWRAREQHAAFSYLFLMVSFCRNHAYSIIAKVIVLFSPLAHYAWTKPAVTPAR